LASVVSKEKTQGAGYVVVVLAVVTPTLFAQASPTVAVRWADLLRQPAAWYGSAEARASADSVLAHQRTSGGWPKNTDMTKPPDPAVLADAARVPDSTIDNGATYTEIRFLATVHRATQDPRYLAAVVRGIDYLLAAQYPDGGWPQFYPLRKDYSRYVTFNDNAMVNVMTLLWDVGQQRAPFEEIDDERRTQSRVAVDKGVRLILLTQLKVNGRLTAWCAQYDPVSHVPRGARTYEHPSVSGSESVAIVRFLMAYLEDNLRQRDALRLKSPRATAVRRDAIVGAVDAAVEWMRRVQLTDQRLERRPDPSLPGGVDVVVVNDPAAPPLWARFYDIGTNRPIFSGRDGIIRTSLAEIEHERRTGYAWLGTWPQALLEKEYPAWKARVEKQ
jgi:PelA/Pel-15E family pectate lyase